MCAMPIKWKLTDILERHNLSAYRIAKDAGIGLTTIYRITNNHTQTVQGKVLEGILETLYDLTGERYDVSDLIEWQPKARKNKA